MTTTAPRRLGQASAELRLVIVIPVFNDWESASILCRELDRVWSGASEREVRLLLVDDGSSDGRAGWQRFRPTALRAIDVLPLRLNVGHQRAIAAGLCHVLQCIPCDYVIVMDADGEDRPDDSVRLAEAAIAAGGPVVFAARRKRIESLVFRSGYMGYRVLHHLLTGIPVRVGNFSVLPVAVLDRLTRMDGLWNHYAGCVYRSRLALATIPIDRGCRYAGTSRMNLVALVMHGLAGIATFQDIVATRLLMSISALMAAAVASLAIVVGIRSFTDWAIPGWAAYTAGLIVLVLLLLIASTFNLVFTLTASRTHATIIPLRHYLHIVADPESLV